ncbi:VOC family protein [Acidisphaera sp. S103]|uniref:VOC family protein n=1 Tax=Acidisphaera sp. S103 TaxID=1747223 RepID=UPI00131C6D82|nr:VOC family protein [Acidisphaera sp. S103]
MRIRAIDHFVLVVLDIEATIKFYTRVLGLEAREIAPGRWALFFGNQKINLQQLHASVDPQTRHPSRGAGDFCLLTDIPMADVVSHLEQQDVKIINGPVQRAGATGPILSVYFYDPDENLVEVSNLIV